MWRNTETTGGKRYDRQQTTLLFAHQRARNRIPKAESASQIRLRMTQDGTLDASHESASYTNRRARVHKITAVDDPLLKVPPARRGNRTRARFPSRSGGNLKEGGQIINFARAIGNRRLCPKVPKCAPVGHPYSRVARLFQESRQGALTAVGQDTLPDSCRFGKTGALSSTASARGWGLQSAALRP